MFLFCFNIGDTKQRRHLANFDLYKWSDGWYRHIDPSSHRPCAEILKMASHEPIMRSIIDRFGQTDDRLWKSSRFPTLLLTIIIVTGRESIFVFVEKLCVTFSTSFFLYFLLIGTKSNVAERERLNYWLRCDYDASLCCRSSAIE